MAYTVDTSESTQTRRQAETLETTDRERWLRPSEAADLFEKAGLWRVPRDTFCRWADARGMTFRRTPGRQRRYAESEVRALIAEISKPAEAVA